MHNPSPSPLREAVKAVQPGRMLVIPYPEGMSPTKTIRRVADAADRAWGKGTYRVAQVAGGVAVMRKQEPEHG